MENDECNEIEINDDENVQIDPSTLPIMVTFYKVNIINFNILYRLVQINIFWIQILKKNYVLIVCYK